MLKTFETRGSAENPFFIPVKNVCDYEGAVGPIWKSNILLNTPDRVEVPILTITSRMNVFTVFGLTFIRLAISLLVNPLSNN
jgi:hypothetical protein